MYAFSWYPPQAHHGSDERFLLRPGELRAVRGQLSLRLRHEPLDDLLDLLRQSDPLGLHERKSEVFCLSESFQAFILSNFELWSLSPDFFTPFYFMRSPIALGGSFNLLNSCVNMLFAFV